MSDDKRIARLTELARRLWHHDEEQPVTVQRGLRGSDPATAFVRTANGVVLDIAAPNDRALDALEAALHVLSGASKPQDFDDPRYFFAALSVAADEWLDRGDDTALRSVLRRFRERIQETR